MNDKHYVVVWIECYDERDAERIEVTAVAAMELIARGRLVQNDIRQDQP